MKKVALWYNILHKLNMLVKEEPEAATEEKTEAKPDSEAEPVAVKKKSTRKPKTE
jgi:hypothetical protein